MPLAADDPELEVGVELPEAGALAIGVGTLEPPKMLLKIEPISENIARPLCADEPPLKRPPRPESKLLPEPDPEPKSIGSKKLMAPAPEVSSGIIRAKPRMFWAKLKKT
jgi:hypothetical protein